MNGEPRQLGRSHRRLKALTRLVSWPCVGRPESLSFALSVAILGLVFLMAAPGNQHASASPYSGNSGTTVLATGQDDGGYVILSESGAGAMATGSGLVGISSPPLTLTVTGHGLGACSICTTDDPSYDPEMGYFTATLSGAFTGNVIWNRAPFVTNTFDLGPFNTGGPSTFLFWLHRSKGCGDFQAWGEISGTLATNAAPFSIPCTPNLAGDTLLYLFEPGPGTMVDTRNPGGVCAPCPVTIRNSGPGKVRINLENLTATPMQAQVLLGFGVVVVGGGDTLESPVGFIANSHAAAFDLSVFGFVPQSLAAAGSAQGLRMAGASPAPITATMVFSFGPTAQISQALVFAPPESVYIPLSERGLDSGW